MFHVEWVILACFVCFFPHCVLSVMDIICLFVCLICEQTVPLTSSLYWTHLRVSPSDRNHQTSTLTRSKRSPIASLMNSRTCKAGMHTRTHAHTHMHITIVCRRLNAVQLNSGISWYHTSDDSQPRPSEFYFSLLQGFILNWSFWSI